MYCSRVCNMSQGHYGYNLEPIPEPWFFDGEDCDTTPCGDSCVYDDVDPDEFNKACCKYGCCRMCDRIAFDAPYLVPYVVACENVRKNRFSMSVKIDELPECKCSDGGGPYTVVATRVRGVPGIYFDESAAADVCDLDVPDAKYNQYDLCIKPKLYIELAIKDCCGYIYTVKTSYTFTEEDQICFNLHCRLWKLKDAVLYFKSKVTLCEPKEIGNGGGEHSLTVNIVIDACVLKYLPYDKTPSGFDLCILSLENGAHGGRCPENTVSEDAPYLVPFPIGCRRYRKERTLALGESHTPEVDCTSGVSVIPHLPTPLPGHAPWRIMNLFVAGLPKVEFKDEDCDTTEITIKVTLPIDVIIIDYCGKLFRIRINYELPEALSIKLGTKWRNVCQGQLYIKSRADMCGGPVCVTEGGSAVLYMDITVEACVMKMIPYQVVGRDTLCNPGQWYFRNICENN